MVESRDDVLELLDLLLLLLAAPDGTFSVLETLSGLLVGLGVFLKLVGTVPVLDALLHVLLLLLREHHGPIRIELTLILGALLTVTFLLSESG